MDSNQEMGTPRAEKRAEHTESVFNTFTHELCNTKPFYTVKCYYEELTDVSKMGVMHFLAHILRISSFGELETNKPTLKQACSICEALVHMELSPHTGNSFEVLFSKMMSDEQAKYCCGFLCYYIRKNIDEWVESCYKFAQEIYSFTDEYNYNTTEGFPFSECNQRIVHIISVCECMVSLSQYILEISDYVDTRASLTTKLKKIQRSLSHRQKQKSVDQDILQRRIEKLKKNDTTDTQSPADTIITKLHTILYNLSGSHSEDSCIQAHTELRSFFLSHSDSIQIDDVYINTENLRQYSYSSFGDDGLVYTLAWLTDFLPEPHEQIMTLNTFVTFCICGIASEELHKYHTEIASLLYCILSPYKHIYSNTENNACARLDHATEHNIAHATYWKNHIQEGFHGFSYAFTPTKETFTAKWVQEKINRTRVKIEQSADTDNLYNILDRLQELKQYIAHCESQSIVGATGKDTIEFLSEILELTEMYYTGHLEKNRHSTIYSGCEIELICVCICEYFSTESMGPASQAQRHNILQELHHFLSGKNCRLHDLPSFLAVNEITLHYDVEYSDIEKEICLLLYSLLRTILHLKLISYITQLCTQPPDEYKKNIPTTRDCIMSMTLYIVSTVRYLDSFMSTFFENLDKGDNPEYAHLIILCDTLYPEDGPLYIDSHFLTVLCSKIYYPLTPHTISYDALSHILQPAGSYAFYLEQNVQDTFIGKIYKNAQNKHHTAEIAQDHKRITPKSIARTMERTLHIFYNATLFGIPFQDTELLTVQQLKVVAASDITTLALYGVCTDITTYSDISQRVQRYPFYQNSIYYTTVIPHSFDTIHEIDTPLLSKSSNKDVYNAYSIQVLLTYCEFMQRNISDQKYQSILPQEITQETFIYLTEVLTIVHLLCTCTSLEHMSEHMEQFIQCICSIVHRESIEKQFIISLLLSNRIFSRVSSTHTDHLYVTLYVLEYLTESVPENSPVFHTLREEIEHIQKKYIKICKPLQIYHSLLHICGISQTISHPQHAQYQVQASVFECAINICESMKKHNIPIQKVITNGVSLQIQSQQEEVQHALRRLHNIISTNPHSIQYAVAYIQHIYRTNAEMLSVTHTSGIEILQTLGILAQNTAVYTTCEMFVLASQRYKPEERNSIIELWGHADYASVYLIPTYSCPEFLTSYIQPQSSQSGFIPTIPFTSIRDGVISGALLTANIQQICNEIQKGHLSCVTKEQLHSITIKKEWSYINTYSLPEKPILHSLLSFAYGTILKKITTENPTPHGPERSEIIHAIARDETKLIQLVEELKAVSSDHPLILGIATQIELILIGLEDTIIELEEEIQHLYVYYLCETEKYEHTIHSLYEEYTRHVSYFEQLSAHTGENKDYLIKSIEEIGQSYKEKHQEVTLEKYTVLPHSQPITISYITHVLSRSTFPAFLLSREYIIGSELSTIVPANSESSILVTECIEHILEAIQNDISDLQLQAILHFIYHLTTGIYIDVETQEVVTKIEESTGAILFTLTPPSVDTLPFTKSSFINTDNPAFPWLVFPDAYSEQLQWFLPELQNKYTPLSQYEEKIISTLIDIITRIHSHTYISYETIFEACSVVLFGLVVSELDFISKKHDMCILNTQNAYNTPIISFLLHLLYPYILLYLEDTCARYHAYFTLKNSSNDPLIKRYKTKITVLQTCLKYTLTYVQKDKKNKTRNFNYPLAGFLQTQPGQFTPSNEPSSIPAIFSKLIALYTTFPHLALSVEDDILYSSEQTNRSLGAKVEHIPENTVPTRKYKYILGKHVISEIQQKESSTTAYPFHFIPTNIDNEEYKLLIQEILRGHEKYICRSIFKTHMKIGDETYSEFICEVSLYVFMEILALAQNKTPQQLQIIAQAFDSFCEAYQLHHYMKPLLNLIGIDEFADMLLPLSDYSTVCHNIVSEYTESSIGHSLSYTFPEKHREAERNFVRILFLESICDKRMHKIGENEDISIYKQRVSSTLYREICSLYENFKDIQNVVIEPCKLYGYVSREYGFTPSKIESLSKTYSHSSVNNTPLLHTSIDNFIMLKAFITSVFGVSLGEFSSNQYFQDNLCSWIFAT